MGELRSCESQGCVLMYQLGSAKIPDLYRQGSWALSMLSAPAPALTKHWGSSGRTVLSQVVAVLTDL